MNFVFNAQVNSLSTLLSPGDSSAVLVSWSGASWPSPGSVGEHADLASPGKGPGLATAPSLSRALHDNAGLETASRHGLCSVLHAGNQMGGEELLLGRERTRHSFKFPHISS